MEKPFPKKDIQKNSCSVVISSIRLVVTVGHSRMSASAKSAAFVGYLSLCTTAARSTNTTHSAPGLGGLPEKRNISRRSCLRGIIGLSAVIAMANDAKAEAFRRPRRWPPAWMRKSFAEEMETGMADYELAVSARKRSLFSSNLLPGQKVLDLGIGTGPNLAYLPSETKCTGLDPNEFMAPYAYRKAKTQLSRGIELSIVDGCAESIPFPPASFDAVIR